MLRSDRRQEFNPDYILGNDDSINNDIISAIERELLDNPYDMISLVFLLYDVPDTALQRLIVFQRVSKDGSSTNLNMLHEWFRHAKHTSTWKHEFLEALLLCQLNSVIRKLGFPVSDARKHYQTDDIHTKMYINPFKKVLYKLCENMNAENLLTLKKTLLTYNIDTTEYDSCELVFLKLMCDKFININQFQYNKQIYGFQAQMDKLVKIIEKLPGLKKLAQDIDSLQQSMYQESNSNPPIAVSTPSAPIKVDEPKQNASSPYLYHDDFNDMHDLLAEASLEDNTIIKSLKSDRTHLENDSFEIKSTKRMGVCVIINQMNFYPSKDSIENPHESNELTTRLGSEKDKAVIENTMLALKFAVYSADNLDHKEMFKFLKDILQEKVSEDDSVFMLCILSHGVKGHVYAADSVKVKMDDIQKLLDSDVAIRLHGKPKLMIIQACQIDENTDIKLVADGPESNIALRKMNYLIYWATAPELEAYRDEAQGSVFILTLCGIIRKYADKEHVCDIFTRVTDKVTHICENLNKAQVPIYHSTLRKKLYLKMPML